MSEFQGKVIIITGGSTGLGKAAAKKLTDLGAKVVIGARRPDRLEEAAKELGLPKEAAIVTDVTDLKSVEALVKKTLDLYGRLDVFVNNAGVASFSKLEALQVKEWEKIIDINIKGVLYGIAAALPVFKEQKSGQFVNTSSVVGHSVYPLVAVYAASKHAVLAISEGLRQEVKPYNIRTTVVSPGATQSEIATSSTDPDTLKMLERFQSYSIPATSFADAVAFAIGQPENVDVNEIIFRPTAAPVSK